MENDTLFTLFIVAQVTFNLIMLLSERRLAKKMAALEADKQRDRTELSKKILLIIFSDAPAQ